MVVSTHAVKTLLVSLVASVAASPPADVLRTESVSPPSIASHGNATSDDSQRSAEGLAPRRELGTRSREHRSPKGSTQTNRPVVPIPRRGRHRLDPARKPRVPAARSQEAVGPFPRCHGKGCALLRPPRVVTSDSPDRCSTLIRGCHHDDPSMRACAAPKVLRATAICSAFHRGKLANTFSRCAASSSVQGARFGRDGVLILGACSTAGPGVG